MTDLTCEWCGTEVIEDGQTVTCDTRHPCPGCGVTWVVSWQPTMCDLCPECGSDDLVNVSDNAACCGCGWIGDAP